MKLNNSPEIKWHLKEMGRTHNGKIILSSANVTKKTIKPHKQEWILAWVIPTQKLI